MIKALVLLLLIVNLCKATTYNEPKIIYGTVKSIQIDNKVTVHHYESSLPILVSSYIIELPTKLVIYDVQYVLPAANELLAHARSLKKPIERVLVSHSHADHYFGLQVFKNLAPIYALEETIREMASNAQFVINANKDNFKDLIPNTPTFPDKIQRIGLEIIDGILFNFTRVLKTDVSSTLVLALPSQRSLFVGDAVFNKVHFFLAEKNFDDWIIVLNVLQRDYLFYNIFQGHGTPTTTLSLTDNINYLEFSKFAYLTSNNFDTFKVKMLNKYPDYKLDFILDLARDRLYPLKKALIN